MYIKKVMQVGDDVKMVGFHFLEREPLFEPTFDANFKGTVNKIC
jgi:hypothetical protein